MNILITGVAGFIGKGLVSQLSQKDHKLIGLDIVETLDKNISGKLDEYRLCDLGDREQTKNSVNDAELIIHLAGEASVNSAENVYKRNNVMALNNLLAAVENNKLQKIILLSTVKADKFEGLYAKSKAESEQNLRDFSKRCRVDFTILRSAAVYGPGMKSHILDWLLRIKSKKIFAIPSSKSKIAMIGRNDLCRVISECISNPKTNNKTYAVSDGIPYPINNIEKTAREVLEFDAEPFCYPKWSLYLGAKFGDIVSRFGGRFPLNSNAYHMFFTNTVNHDSSIFNDIGIKPEQNFLEEIPTLFAD